MHHATSDGYQGNPSLRRRKLAFDAAVLVISGIAVVLISALRIFPLSAPPVTAPNGLELAWAGQQLRGYSETVYITASSCSAPAQVILDLYTKNTPGSVRRTKNPGKVAFAITGGGLIPSHRATAWGSPHFDVASALLYKTRSGLVRQAKLKLKKIQHVGADRQRLSQVFTFHWNSITYPHLTVTFDANWLSKRTTDDSCWLNAPGLVNGLDASSVANRAIGRPKWSRSSRGQPIQGASNIVNVAESGHFQVNPAASIPTPIQRSPAIWRCGGGGSADVTCQAAVVLESPGADSGRSRVLAIWSMLGGIGLAAFGTALVGMCRTLVVDRQRLKQRQ